MCHQLRVLNGCPSVCYLHAVRMTRKHLCSAFCLHSLTRVDLVSAGKVKRSMTQAQFLQINSYFHIFTRVNVTFSSFVHANSLS